MAGKNSFAIGSISHASLALRWSWDPFQIYNQRQTSSLKINENCLHQMNLSTVTSSHSLEQRRYIKKMHTLEPLPWFKTAPKRSILETDPPTYSLHNRGIMRPEFSFTIQLLVSIGEFHNAVVDAGKRRCPFDPWIWRWTPQREQYISHPLGREVPELLLGETLEYLHKSFPIDPFPRKQESALPIEILCF